MAQWASKEETGANVGLEISSFYIFDGNIEPVKMALYLTCPRVPIMGRRRGAAWGSETTQQRGGGAERLGFSPRGEFDVIFPPPLVQRPVEDRL